METHPELSPEHGFHRAASVSDDDEYHTAVGPSEAAGAATLRGSAFVLYLYSKEVPILAIRLPAAIEKRLERLAKRTGRTKTFYAREAILQHLEDLEDVYLAEQAYHRYLKGEDMTIPLEEAMKRHGLADDLGQ